MAVRPTLRMGPPSRSSAADAYVCIMVEVLLDPPNTSSRHGSVLLEAGSTSAVIPTTTSVSACSVPSRYGLEAMERKIGPERRPTLTAPARADLRILWVGTKRRASRSNKETGDRKEEKVEFAARLALDFKNPIQVQIQINALSCRPVTWEKGVTSIDVKVFVWPAGVAVVIRPPRDRPRCRGRG